MNINPPQTEDSDLSLAGVIQLSKRARRLFRQKNYAASCELYHQGLVAAPNNLYLLSGLGDACREAGDYGRAFQAYSALLRIDVNNLFGLRGMGDLLKNQGDIAGAIPYWERYLALRKADAHVMTRLAEAFKSLEKYQQAESLYRNILHRDSEDCFALAGLADLLQRTGRDTDAIACYEKILTLRHDMLPVLTLVGRLCWRIADFEKSERFFLKALEIEPDNPYALYGLGNCYRGQHNLEKAIEVWERILDHNEGTAALYSRMGDAYTLLGDFPSAEKAYRQVLDQGYDLFALIGMVKLCCDRGDFWRAGEALSTLLANEQDPWRQIDELSRRLVGSGRRETLIKFYHHLLDPAVPNLLDPGRVKQLLSHLESVPVDEMPS